MATTLNIIQIIILVELALVLYTLSRYREELIGLIKDLIKLRDIYEDEVRSIIEIRKRAEERANAELENRLSTEELNHAHVDGDEE